MIQDVVMREAFFLAHLKIERIHAVQLSLAVIFYQMYPACAKLKEQIQINTF